MGTLQVVATPIGNLEDISIRALRTLSEADLLFAEDTRRARVLLERYEVDARPISLHEHNEASRVERALAVLRDDGRVALISDAGTPLVSDPGGRLVEAAIADGHRVEPIPGASAVLSALTVSGLATAPFTFVGFLPRRGGACRALLEGYRGRPETLVFFESPRRVAATLELLEEVLGDRPACAARELTKLHEEVSRGSLKELRERFAGGARGELTLVVAGDEAADLRSPERDVLKEWSEDELCDEIRAWLDRGRRPREIAAQLSRTTGMPRRQIYARAVALKEAE